MDDSVFVDENVLRFGVWMRSDCSRSRR